MLWPPLVTIYDHATRYHAERSTDHHYPEPRRQWSYHGRDGDLVVVCEGVCVVQAPRGETGDAGDGICLRMSAVMLNLVGKGLFIDI